MNIECQFDRFAESISGLPADFSASHPLPAALRMQGDFRYEIYYAPFDHVLPSARIVLVGITPGRAQALAALETARRALLANHTHDVALAKAKTTASFAGPMRRNLVDLLDHIGVADRLGIPTTANLALWACERQIERGLLRHGQVLRGLPHPSGANAERIAYFLGRKPRHKLSTKTRPESLDAGREMALRCVAGWA